MSRFRRLFHLKLWGPDIEEGIDWEILHHIEERTDELREAGMSEEEAQLEARRSFGDDVRVRSELRRIDRDQRRRARLRETMGTVWQDVRYGVRGVVTNAGFAAALVLTLALGIGANGALFSVADALLLRPLPFAAPGELVDVFQATPQAEHGRPYVSPQLARSWLEQQTAVTAAFLHWRGSATYAGGEEPTRLNGLGVTEGFQTTLGVSPMLGRSFSAEDMVPGAPPVVLLAHEFWRSALAGTPDVLGADIELNGIPHRVIGVMPRGFKYPLYSTTEFWVPLHDDDRYFGNPVQFVEITARVGGSDLAVAEAAASALAISLIRETRPESETYWRLRPAGERRSNEELQRAMQLLSGAVALILLIAGVNMVNLLLLRGAARTREIAVRLALGASRWRLVRQLGTEAMLLALLSGVVATAFAFGALRVLQHIMPSSITFYAPHAIELETRTLLFTFILAVLSGFVFGLLPALRATRLGSAAGAAGLAGSATEQPAGSSVLRRVLVTTEVALSVTLLVGAGLLISSFIRLTQVPAGIELERLAVLDLSIASRDFTEPESRAAYLRLLEERISGVAGVVAVTTTGGLPPRGGGLMFGLVLEAEGEEPLPLEGIMPMTNAAPDFFEVTGARLIAGRPFHSGEDGASGAVIINRELAAHLWPGRNAISRRFRTGEQAPWLTVVGITADFRLRPPDDVDNAFAMIYPPPSNPEGGMLAIRTSVDARRVLQPVRAAVHEVNQRQVIDRLDTASAYYAESMDMQRFLYVVITALALLALTLTVVGMYGLLSYGVARRHREIGVRLALGARAAQVHRLILGEALALTAAGAVIGGFGALVMSRFIEATLFGVEPTDPRTFAIVAAVIFAAATLASLLPAHRAAGVDPAVVLRAD
jgi:putative ABC transport system permease protein